MTEIMPVPVMRELFFSPSNPESRVRGIPVRSSLSLCAVAHSADKERGKSMVSWTFTEATIEGTSTLPQLSLISTDFSPR